MAELLSDDEIEERLSAGWHREGEEIVRTYEFEEYLAGVAFASEVGERSEAAFHHPEIVVRYGEVEVRFTTHDAGGITEKDLEMAERCDEARELV